MWPAYLASASEISPCAQNSLLRRSNLKQGVSVFNNYYSFTIDRTGPGAKVQQWWLHSRMWQQKGRSQVYYNNTILITLITFHLLILILKPVRSLWVYYQTTNQVMLIQFYHRFNCLEMIKKQYIKNVLVLVKV